MTPTSTRTRHGMIYLLLGAVMSLMVIMPAMAQESFRATHIARLDGESEQPDPVASPGIGIAIMRLDETARSLEYRISVSALPDVSAAHFHRGGTDVAGPVAHPIAFPTTFGLNHTVTGTWSDISQEDMGRFERGEIYINFHTPANPAGEIRGQVEIIPNLSATLSPGEVVPPVISSNSIGDALILLDRDARRLDYILRWSDLTGPPVSAGFYNGRSGEAGTVVHTIQVSQTSDMVMGTWTNISPADIDRLIDRGIYLSIATEENQGGEIRGQVFPIEFFTSAISPENEVERPDNSESAGTGYMLIASMTDAFYDLAGDFIVDGTTGPIAAAGIYEGAAGISGQVIERLVSFDEEESLWSVPIFTFIESEQATMFREVKTYAGFHTTEWPDGELRGQLVPAENNLTIMPASVQVERHAVAGAPLAAMVDPATGDIRFTIADGVHGGVRSIVLYSMLGVRVADLAVEGNHALHDSRELASGLYIAQLVVDGRTVGGCRVMVRR